MRDAVTMALPVAPDAVRAIRAREGSGRAIVWIAWRGESWPALTLARHLGVTADALIHRHARGRDLLTGR
jgi:hypothetical protein